MSKKIKKKPAKSFFTTFLEFWTTLPGIIGGITGLILAIGGLYAALRPVSNVVNSNDSRASTSSVAAPTPASQAVTPTLTPLQSPAPSSAATPLSNVCSNQYFSVIPKDRLKSIKLGVTAFPLITIPKQSKDGMVGIHLLNDTGVEIGAIIFNHIFTPTEENRPDEVHFKVEHLLNSKCQEIEPKEYFVNPHDEDKPRVHNWAEIRMTLDGQKSWLRLGYNDQSHIIFADFRDRAYYDLPN